MPAPRKRKLDEVVADTKGNLLEEEDYLERMGKVIRRDFFPAIKKIEDFKNRCKGATPIFFGGGRLGVR